MIIFDLDGTLANCEHRMYLVDRMRDHPDYYRNPCDTCADGSHHKSAPQIHKQTGEIWKPDYVAFDQACDNDTLIKSTGDLFHYMQRCDHKVQIWTGRSESVREKTIEWLIDKLRIDYCSRFCTTKDLKMRPIGDFTPGEDLKERWLNERCADLITAQIEGRNAINHDIDFVFDDGEESIDMWRRRGIFVFDCNQTGMEF